MAFNSITRLRLRKLTTPPAFMREVEAILTQTRASAGFLGGALGIEGLMVAWTRTAWESEAAMKAFRDSGAHQVSMPKLIDWCDEACVAHWEGDVETDWAAIHARLARDLPTEAHQQKRIAPLRRWVPEHVVTPASKNPRG